MDKVLRFINVLLLSIVGMLLLICVSVLVQGSKIDMGKAVDWWTALAAIATSGTFAVALFAYRKVPDWLSPKLKDKQFKFADELIEGFCALQQEALHLFTDVSFYLNSNPELNSNFYVDRVNVGLKIESYIKNMILLRAKMERMVLWGLTLKDEGVFHNVMKQHEALYASCIVIRDYKLSHASSQVDGFIEINKNFLKVFLNLGDCHKVIIRPYNELFEVQ